MSRCESKLSSAGTASSIAKGRTRPRTKRKGRRIQIGRSLLEHLGPEESETLTQQMANKNNTSDDKNTAYRRRRRHHEESTRTLTAESILMDWNSSNYYNNEMEKRNNQKQPKQHEKSRIVKPESQERLNVSTLPRKAEELSNASNVNDDDDSSSSSSSSSSSGSTITDDSTKYNLPDTRENFLRRQLAALADSDDEGAIPRKEREPLRPGDVISYYHPLYVYGNMEGYRVTQVLATRRRRRPRDGCDGLLDLDNGEFLPADTRVRRVGVFRRGRVVARTGSTVARDICHFRLRTRRLVLPVQQATGLARHVERLRQAVLQCQQELQQDPPEVWSGMEKQGSFESDGTCADKDE